LAFFVQDFSDHHQHLFGVLVNVILKVLCVAHFQCLRELRNFDVIKDVILGELDFLKMSLIIVEKRDAERLVDKMPINTLQIYLSETLQPFLMGCTSKTTIVLAFRDYIF
jgi:hypothetical protein